MKTKFIFILSIVITIFFQSCVINKEVYISEMEKNFQEQKNEFLEKRGLDKSTHYFDVYYSDNSVKKEYDVVSYNHVDSWIPLRPFIYKKWQVKYRLHQYMHNAYCLGVLPSIDAMIVDADLSGVKYIRYKNSTKEAFVIPTEPGYTNGIIGGIGLTISSPPELSIITGGFQRKKEINCVKSIRKEYGFVFKKLGEESSSSSKQDPYGIFALNYKYIFSNSISEYLSNTWNVRPGKSSLYTEFGLDMNLFETISTHSEFSDGKKDKETTFLKLGPYAGLRLAVTDKIDFNLGVSVLPIAVFNKVDMESTLFSTGFDSNRLNILLRLSYNL
jgi:hypothetical protein